MNYIKLKSRLLKQEYAFFDFSEGYVWSFLNKNALSVHFTATWRTGDSPYILAFCEVPKRKTEEFEKAMRQLEWKMVVCGHTDYPDYCTSFFKDRSK